jgi:hypothetical protein
MGLKPRINNLEGKFVRRVTEGELSQALCLVISHTDSPLEY